MVCNKAPTRRGKMGLEKLQHLETNVVIAQVN